MLHRGFSWRSVAHLKNRRRCCAPRMLFVRDGFLSLLAVAASLVIAAFTADAASAQGWVPERHVELTVPGGAGGSLDGTARTVHRLWQELKLLPVTSMVMNRGGGGHAIGYDYVRQRTGDPHYLGRSPH